MDVSSTLFDIFSSLALEVMKGTLSLDEAVRRIHEDLKIKTMLNEKAVAELTLLAERIANQPPPLAYYLAYLTYEAAKIIKNRLLLGITSFTLANFSLYLAKYHQAIELYQEALSTFKELNNEQRVGAVLGNLGNAHYSLGQYQKAIGYFEDALKIAKEIGDRKGEGNSLGNLGNAYYSLGQYQKAIGYFEDALKIAKEIGDRQGEGSWLGNLGIAYYSLGQYQKAIGYFEDALKIAKEIGNRKGEGSLLGNLGIVYRSLGQYQKAIGYFEDALKIAKEIGNRKGEGSLLGNLGNAHYSLGQYQKAIGYFENALKIAKEIGDRRNEGSLLGNLGNAYYSLGQYQKAIGYFENALKIAKEIGDRQGEGSWLGNLGIAYYSLGQYQKAIGYFEDALKIAKETGDRKGEGSWLGNLGNAYYSLGQYQKAIGYFEDALKIAKEIGDRQGEGSWLGNLGIVYRSLGQYQKAIGYFENALKIAKEIGDRKGEGSRLGNLGNAFASLGQYQKAIGYFEDALKIAKEIGDRQGEGSLLGNLGIAYYSLGQYQKAIGYFEDALKITKKIGDREGEGSWLGNLGIAYDSLGQYQKAIGYFEDALKIAKEIGDRKGEGSWLGNLGIVYDSLGQYQKAIGYFEDALKIAKETGDVDNERISNLNLGIVYEDHILKSDEAYGYYQRSIELSESMRGGLIEESHKIGFFSRIEDAYYRMVTLCHKLNKEKQAYEYTERAKSRAFLDLLATTEIKPSIALPPELKQREDVCLGLLRQVQRRPYLGETTPKPQINVIKVAEDLEIIYNEIEKYDPEYAFLRRGRPLSFNQIQGLLETQDRRTALVEYFVTKNEVFIFVIRGDDSRLYVEKKPISGERLYRYIENYWREVANYLKYDDMRQTWQELSQYLIEPIAKYLKRGEVIYIVPHGVLHYLPFHALRHDGRYLIEDFQIVYSPSASLIKYCQSKRIDKFESCLSLGVVFEEEAEMVAKLFNTSAYTGEGVTEDLVQRECKDKDIIHFSCHGRFNHLQPISSGLVLSNDKLLSVNDIFNLKLNANLVTLSACVTGISDQRPGDELIGLTRGFIYAGTPSVVVSLWSVEAESTLQLMKKFYTYLINDKMTKVEALQKAQLEIMEKDKYKHPYYWAPFILVGDRK
jgi:tetratricopeptide (TPR) repeat protein